MNKTEFQDFKKRLHSHHRLNVNNECTSSPIYLVQKKVVDWGYEEEYAEHHQLYCSCEGISYDTLQEFLEEFEEEKVNSLLEDFGYKISVKDLLSSYSEVERLRILDEILNHSKDYKYNDYYLVHGNERYETVGIFLTYKAAENFLTQKGWKLGDEGARIYIDSVYRSKEFRDVLDLIVEDKLEFKG